MKKRGLIGVLVLALVSFMLPVTSLAVAAGELTIELTNGGDPVLGTSGVAGDGDYYYNGNVLYINSDTAMTLSGTAVADRIVICAGVAANLTFSGLTITSEKGALEITDGASANITLVGANSLTSGGIYAGILVPQNSALTITAASTGSLNVTANQGAGIGVNNPSGSASYTCGTVNIYGGTVIASSTFGAAIGAGTRAETAAPSPSAAPIPLSRLRAPRLQTDLFSYRILAATVWARRRVPWRYGAAQRSPLAIAASCQLLQPILRTV